MSPDRRLSAADILWGNGLTWTMMFKLVPDWPALVAYANRLGGRPSVAKAKAMDAALAAQHEAGKAAG